MTDAPKTEEREVPYELDMKKAQEMMAKIYDIFKENNLSPPEGLGCLGYAVAFTILSQMGPTTFEENMNEFVRVTCTMFNGMLKQVAENEGEIFEDKPPLN